jgi:hypothetical protein
VLDETLRKFCDNLAVQNEGSARTVQYYLQDLEAFSTSDFHMSPTELIKRLKEGTATEDPKEEQPYVVLQRHAAWLKKTRLESDEN